MHVDAALPTVLVYGHYDVQPPDPLDLWNSPPFEPMIKDGLLYARGACDDKGQLLMHLKALECWMRTTGQPPVNLKFILEGEEESGSASLSGFIREHKDALAADIVVISGFQLVCTGNSLYHLWSTGHGLCGNHFNWTGPGPSLRYIRRCHSQSD